MDSLWWGLMRGVHLNGAPGSGRDALPLQRDGKPEGKGRFGGVPPLQVEMKSLSMQ